MGELLIERIPLEDHERILPPKKFQRMPTLYLELLENKTKVRRDLLNEFYIPPPLEKMKETPNDVHETLEQIKKDIRSNTRLYYTKDLIQEEIYTTTDEDYKDIATTLEITNARHISTKTGDEGFSRNYSNDKLSKTDVLFDTVGNIDEFSSTLGVCFHQTTLYKKEIMNIQKDLQNIMSIIATNPEDKNYEKLTKIASKDINNLGKNLIQIDLDLY